MTNLRSPTVPTNRKGGPEDVRQSKLGPDQPPKFN